MNTNNFICPSTHGMSGYAFGSYWDGDDVICGICGVRIVNAPVHSWRIVYYSFWENPIKWLLGKEKAQIPLHY